ncbi:TPA: DNA helicase, partial [Candidatus Sumerlaeota bacterium]|nr:DNA helicase [Candidatus Sumerlaeota bacterium]
MPDNIQAVVSPQEISTSATTAPSLQIDMELDPTVNFAMQQNDVPIVQSLKITNLTQTEIRDVQVEIRTEPEFAMLWKTQIASLPSAGTYHLGVVDLELSPQHLLELTERVAGIVHVEVKSEQTVLAQTTSRIEILAHDEWSGLRSLPEILAAFVLPNHPDVERILSRAAQILKEWTGNSSLSGYQSKDRKRVLEIVAAIYTAIQSQELTYVNPPSSFEQCGQKIRLPHRIFENKMGTCLDLAVLCAACVEQAGLFPLLVLTNGHAFTGAWLEEECFQDSASDDGLRLKKRIDLEEICVFETTLLTGSASLNFECAMQEGNRQLDDLDAFRCVLDIQRCRKSRIRPLPIRVSGTSIEIVSTPPSTESVIPQEAIAPDFSGFGKAQQADLLNNTSGQITETPATRLDKWKRNLLDLTMRNRLLNFRESHKTLPILCPDLYSLEDSLADGEAFKILERPAEMSAGQPRSQELHFQRTGQDALTELIKAEFSAKRLRADVTENELNRRLLEIHREARNSLEEGGANTLFLALGFLSWYETSDSQQARIAPIILIPIELKRRSMLEGFRICLGDEESRINTTLLELLVQEFELRVPLSDPLPTDEHGIDVQGILNTFKHAVKNIDRWEVLEKAQIGLFSFTKYLMWRDLEVRAGDLARNKVVSHLINRSNKAFVNEGELPQVEHLDHTYKPENTFCPLSSDSSQLVAIHAAAEGKSFVLQGPPGTGKSQTITNLIAHCLATGKTVLFVSEKMAALNVV